VLERAVAALKGLRAEGDTSERTAIGLGLGLGVLGDVEDREGRPGLALSLESEAALRPFYDAPQPSAAVRRAYGMVALSLGTYQGRDGAPMIERAKGAFASLGALDLTDIAAAADYAQASAYEGAPLWIANRDAELRTIETEAADIAGRVLEQRPGHMVALRAQNGAYGWLAAAAFDDLRWREASRLQLKSAEAAAALVRLDPTNSDDRQSYAQAYQFAGVGLIGAGATREGVALLDRAIAILAAEPQPSPVNLQLRYNFTLETARAAADLGDRALEQQRVAQLDALLARIRRSSSPGTMFRANAEGVSALGEAERAFLDGRLREAAPLAAGAVEKLKAARGNSEFIDRAVRERRERASRVQAEVAYFLGDYATALAAARAAGANLSEEMRSKPEIAARLALDQSLAALSLARLGRGAEARTELAPALGFVRAALPRNHDAELPRAMAVVAFLAQAIADPAAREQGLAAAERTLADVPANVRRLASVACWDRAVREERARAH